MTRGIKRLQRTHRAPLLLQEAANARSIQTEHTVYANATGSCAIVCPPDIGAHVIAQFSDAHFHALVLSNEIALVSVYLPDSAKSDHEFQVALDSVSVGLDVLHARYRLRGLVVAGDFNVELTPVLDGGVLGTCLWPALGPRFTERQEMTLHFCGRHGLVHGPSHVPGNPLERWTRESWGAAPTRSSLDHLLLSHSLFLVRWTPWPEDNFCQLKRRLWGDHRPVLAAMTAASASHNFDLRVSKKSRSLKGWAPACVSDLDVIGACLKDWVACHAPEILSLPLSDWASVAGIVSSSIVDACVSVPHSTFATRKSGCVGPPAQLVTARRAFQELASDDHVGRTANRRLQRKYIRQWHTQRFDAMGGLRSARFRDSWRSLSFVQLRAGEAPTCDRGEWRAELVRHWASRFADPLDSLTEQAQLCTRLFDAAGGRVVLASLGEVVLALAGAGSGAAGGLDGPVNEMLHVLPWSFVCFLHDVFNRRFRADLEGYRAEDAWRTFVATWIRKDAESDLLGSFRPIMQSSVLLKCIERVILGPSPMQLLVHRAPLWGFRPRMSSAMLCSATAAAVKTLLQFNLVDLPAQGSVDGVFLTVDVEKAFDKIGMDAQVRALTRVGFRPERIATLASELLGSSVFVRLGDAEVGPLPHTRGKQGGCSTPFVFSAVLAVVMESRVLEWQRRGWGIPLAGQGVRFSCAVFADNVLLCGSCAQVVAMYAELTCVLHSFLLSWKPSSFHALGPVGCAVALPAVGAQPSRVIHCSQRLTWLGQVISYDQGWDAEYDACFASATTAWNINRKWLYNRRLTLRVRVRMFAQSVIAVLVSRLCQLPCSPTVLQRARRWENRCLRALTGMNNSYCTLAMYAAATRNARKIAAKVGHIDVVVSCLRRHFSLAGQWLRLPDDTQDLAMRDFKACWTSALDGTWRRLQAEGTRRSAPGRPRPRWDTLLSEWSDGRWLTWGRCQSTWNDLADDWVAWALRRVGVAAAEIPQAVLHRGVGLPMTVDHAPTRMNVPCEEHVGAFVACDSMVLTRTLQGRWAPRTAWLASLVRAANDVAYEVSSTRPLCTAHEGWWICHTPRTSNSWSDGVAKFAKEAMIPPTMWVHIPEYWASWCSAGGAGCWYVSTDGSTSPAPSYARGLSGASCTLWTAVQGNWWPVATLAASCDWAAAVESESAALVLALCLLQLSSNVSLHAVFAVEGASWFSRADVDEACRSAEESDIAAFCQLVGITPPRGAAQCRRHGPRPFDLPPAPLQGAHLGQRA